MLTAILLTITNLGPDTPQTLALAALSSGHRGLIAIPSG